MTNERKGNIVTDRLEKVIMFKNRVTIQFCCKTIHKEISKDITRW